MFQYIRSQLIKNFTVDFFVEAPRNHIERNHVDFMKFKLIFFQDCTKLQFSKIIIATFYVVAVQWQTFLQLLNFLSFLNFYYKKFVCFFGHALCKNKRGRHKDLWLRIVNILQCYLCKVWSQRRRKNYKLNEVINSAKPFIFWLIQELLQIDFHFPQSLPNWFTSVWYSKHSQLSMGGSANKYPTDSLRQLTLNMQHTRIISIQFNLPARSSWELLDISGRGEQINFNLIGILNKRRTKHISMKKSC